MDAQIKSPLWILWIFVIGCAFYITLMFSKKYEIPALVLIFIFDLIIILSAMVPKMTFDVFENYWEWIENLLPTNKRTDASWDILVSSKHFVKCTLLKPKCV